MTPLVVHSELATFGSAARPLRPSKISKLLDCAMSVVLTMHEDRGGGVAAQTGNLVHDAAEWYHKTIGVQEARVAAGLAALEAARAQFPEGDTEKAVKIFGAYAADKTNQDAKVLWVEQPVRLVLQPDPGDPTQAEIVIEGTLDQVRLQDGVARVWDIKTGGAKSGEENVLDYLAQQATYTLAARATLDPGIQPGGLIYTPGYDKVRGKVHLLNPLTVTQCEDLLLLVPPLVSMIRQGRAVFRPSAKACQWCEVRPWPKCHARFTSIYGGLR